MSSESTDLVEARELLSQFEAEMERANCLAHLADGLSLLAVVRDNPTSSIEQQIASNVALAYARKAGAKVESLLSREPRIHWETLRHWRSVLSEFERAGFQLPLEVAQVHSNLVFMDAERSIESLSPSERKALLDRLRALDRQKGI